MPPTTRKADPKRVTALIVDDDRDTREMYTYFLAGQGVKTIEAEDGAHALAKASSILPDIISTDLTLPHMNGVELCRSLKQHERTRLIPVIALTGRVSKDDAEEAKKAGCISVLTKPCPPETLHLEIRRVLALRRPAKRRVPVP